MKNPTLVKRGVAAFLFSIFASIEVPAQTWDGGADNDNWSAAANWSPDGVPANDGTAALLIGGSNRTTPIIDTAWSIQSLAFLSGASAFTLSGNALTITSTATSGTTGLTNNSGIAQTISAPISLGAPGAGTVTWNTGTVSSGGFFVSGALNLSDDRLQLTGAGNAVISGNIGGTGNSSLGAITLNSSFTGELRLSGINTFSQLISINNGSLILLGDAPAGAPGALGSSNAAVVLGNTTASANTALLVGGAYTVGRPISVRSGNTGVATLGGNSSDVCTFSGNITLGSSTTTGKALTITAAAGGTVRFTGNLLHFGTNSDTNDAVTKVGLGTAILSGTANSYTGQTLVNGGTLLINGAYATPGGAITVTSGATLGGFGSINRAIVGNGGSALLVGDGLGASGTLTLNNTLNLATGAGIKVPVGPAGAHATLVRGGTGPWAFAANQMVTLVDLGASAGTYAGVITGLDSDPGVATWTLSNGTITGSFVFHDGAIDLIISEVLPPGIAPAITVQPVSQTVTAFSSVSFSVTATGTPSPSYQWLVDGVAIPGATEATLALTAVTANDAGNYTCLVSNYAGSIVSAPALLTVNKAPATVTLTGLSTIYDGFPKNAVASTTPGGLAVVLTYNGSATPPINVGSYSVSAVINDSNYTGGVTGNLVIAVAETPIAINGLKQIYDGLPKAVSTNTVPGGLEVHVTYNGSESPPTDPGLYTVLAEINDPNRVGSASGTLLITAPFVARHAPAINGGLLDGSIWVLLPESFSINGNATISGDVLVPGTPTVQVNGSAMYVGTRDGVGASLPSNYYLTLNSGSVLRHVVRRVDPVSLATVAAPPMPAGTRDVVLNVSGQSAGDFSTLRNLTLNSNVGFVAIPGGTYGNFIANSSSGFSLGVEGASEPTHYYLQNLTLNSSSQLTVLGPVVLTVANGVSINGHVGAANHSDWLTLRIANGGATVGSNVAVYGRIEAPAGTVTLNSGSVLSGGAESDRLTINGSATATEVSATQYRPKELVFTAANTYTNPFDRDQIDLQVTFTGPDGQEMLVHGFWDGGADHRTWKVRFAPPTAGSWTFQTTAIPSDSGLHNKIGGFVAAPASGPNHLFQHGGILRRSEDKRHFVYQDGTPFFYLADTWWFYPCYRVPIYASENNDIPANVAEEHPQPFNWLVDTRADQGYTALQINGTRGMFKTDLNFDSPRYIFTKTDSYDDVTYWQRFDLYMQYAMERGLVVNLGVGTGLLFDAYSYAELERLIGYMLARYGAYPMIWHTTQEYNTPEGTDPLGRKIKVFALNEFFRETDPYRRVIGMHIWPAGPRTYVDDSWDEVWNDYIFTETAHFVTPHPGLYLFKYFRPNTTAVLEGELNYEGFHNAERNFVVDSEMVRRSAYTAIQSGCFGYAYGATGLFSGAVRDEQQNPFYGYPVVPWWDSISFVGAGQLRHMRDCYEMVEWWRLAPKIDAVRQNASILVKADEYRTLLVWFPSNVTVAAGTTLTGTAYNGATYDSKWFNPRTGEKIVNPPIVVTTPALALPTKPDANDWMLILTYSGGGTLPPEPVDSIQIQQAWEFNESTEGWTAGTNVSGFAFQPGGYVGGTSNGSNPLLLSPDGLGIPITNAKIIKIRLRNTSTSVHGQIYFKTTAQSALVFGRHFTMTSNDPDYTEYTIDMGDVPTWTGTLQQLRVDPGDGTLSGATANYPFSIDYVRIGQP